MTSGIQGKHESSSNLPSQSPPNERMRDGSKPQRNMKRRRLTRLVSQNELSMSSSCEKMASEVQKRSETPRCISQFDKSMQEEDPCSSLPPLPNPLDNANIRKNHEAALRLEADLHPMRLILARLRAHPTHNRKGIFNQPVDPVALGLPDYNRIVTRPMDLGTVKRRLHAVAYQSRQQVADDIRLVFTNAIRYNPPHNTVHHSAKELLAKFEEAYEVLPPCVSANKAIPVSSTPNTVLTPPDVATSSATALNTVQSEPSLEASSTAVEPSTSSATELSICKIALPETEQENQTSPKKTPLTHGNTVPQNSPTVLTRNNRAPLQLASNPTKRPKRKARLPPFLPHTCQSCLGRECAVCKQGCLLHEPALLVCQGLNCGGAKIRKGSQYFISKDGNRQFCPRCFTNLPPVLPGASENDECRYKKDLLKRKNDEEIAEQWLTCSRCSIGVHAVCAMHNGFVHQESDYVCPDCQDPGETVGNHVEDAQVRDDTYTFISGSDIPEPMSSMGVTNEVLSSDRLPECSVSSFIQEKVRACMDVIPNADKTVTVRVISDCSRHFNVPDVVRRHFRMATDSDAVIKPPATVNYRQKAIALFQRIDGLDVCIYCMYVQEYDGDDEYDDKDALVKPHHNKRVYIAYIDSVEHFRPRECRTQVYHEILVSYLATARERGYEAAHIWACPPSRGNNFVFWNHPASQRTPTKERLVAWYHNALSRAVECGIVTDVKSMYESDFQKSLSELENEVNACDQPEVSRVPCGRMVCPPLLDGDFWIEEAVRVHQMNISRNLKIRSPTEVCVWNVSTLSVEDLDPCPALQAATLIKDRIMTHPSSVHFRRPVNAASMKLSNYHKIISNPMDLGTIYSRCVLGEYHFLREMVEDVKLMVANAKKFNPVGHFVHTKADEILDLFFQELAALTKFWGTPGGEEKSWESYSDMSMSLDMAIDMAAVVNKTNSVFIEDDRSSDGSKSTSSSVSVLSPMSRASLTKEDESTQSPSTPSPCTTKRTVSLCSSKAPARRNSKKRKVVPRRNLSLLSDGPEAVMQCMVGDDVWLLDKRNTNPPKGMGANKNGRAKRRRSSISKEAHSKDPVGLKRRQSWVGEEVGHSVRAYRTSFFTCSLTPKAKMSDMEQEKLRIFSSYADSFDSALVCQSSLSSPLVDARCALLEFSQFRNLEFNTLRRAKYSTAMLLYHLHHRNAPGVIPVCTTCEHTIESVRWHKVRKLTERRRVTKNMFKPTKPLEPIFVPEELCVCCHSQHPRKEDFIPIPVSLKPQ